jgi:aldose 1-epimerase
MPPSEANTDDADAEITLAGGGDLRLRVSPRGASLRGLWREPPGGRREEIITGYSGAANKVGGQGDVLIPFPGRVRDGRYVFGGESYEMVRNDKDGPNAIHGFLRAAPWQVTARSDRAATFSAGLVPGQHAGYPFSLRADVTYELDPHRAGMTCRFAVENTGDTPAPVGAGFHPYFIVGSPTIDDARLRVPMASTLELDAGLLPTGRVLPVDGTAYDFRTARPVDGTVFNTCYLHPLRDADGLLRIRLQGAEEGGRAVTVWMDRAFDYAVLYSGDPLPPSHRRRALAIEPMTCGSDAFNYPEWGLVALAPGETLAGAWGVTPG